MDGLSRARAIRGQIALLKGAEQYQKDAEVLEDKRGVLEERRISLRTAVDTAIVLVKSECLSPQDIPDMEGPEAAIEKLVTAFGDHPAAIAKGQIFGSAIRQLERVTTELEAANMNAWKQQTDSLPSVNEQLLRLIEQLPGQRAKVSVLRSVASNLELVTARPPSTMEQWTNYREYVAVLETGLQELSSDRFPKPVLEFCIAAQRDGADLSMLTDEVRDWLKGHNLYDSLRYRFKATRHE